MAIQLKGQKPMSEKSLMQPAPGVKSGRNRKKCLFTLKSWLDMTVKCRTHSFWRGGSLTHWYQGTHWCLCRGRIPVPGALNQAFNIIDLITLSILLLSLQLLMFSCCWKGQTQPQISLKATHLKQQDDTSRVIITLSRESLNQHSNNS